MKAKKTFPEVYKEQCKIPFSLKEAVIYYFNPMKVPKSFYDASGGPFDVVPVDCWLFLKDEFGIVGQAPCGPIMEKRILPLIMTGEKKTYEEWYEKCYWTIRNDGFSSGVANELGRLDLALHDLMAKRAELPLHKFLGATRNWAKVYASGCGTNLTLDECIVEVDNFLDKGYDCFKIKVGTNFGTTIDADIEKIRVIRSEIGEDKRLAVDVNQIWKANEAMTFYDKIAKFNIAWYEEPVHSHDFRELAKITQMCPVPIGMGESVKNYYMLEEYVHCGVGQLQPIPTNLCAVKDWWRGRQLAYDHDIEFTSGGISQLTASYIASGKETDMVEYLAPIIAPLAKYMKRVPEEKDGKFILDELPGAGLEPDLELMRKMGVIKHIEFMN